VAAVSDSSFSKGNVLVRLGAIRPIRHAAVLVIDAAIVAGSLLGAFALRFEGAIPIEQLVNFFFALPILVAIRLGSELVMGLHRWSFRMSGLNEAVRLAMTNLFGTVCFITLFFWGEIGHLPRTVVALEFFFTTSLLGVMRFVPRLAMGWYMEQRVSEHADAKRTIIVGAGSAGDLLLRDLLRSHEHSYQVIGFVDDNLAKVGSSIGGKPVLGTLAMLPGLVERHQVNKVLLAITRLSSEKVRHILKLCAHLKVSFKIIPASFAYLNKRVTAAILHDLSPEDLLHRDKVAFDSAEIRGLVAGRRILVSGAAGSIGAEIARQVSEHAPEELTLIDINENGLYLLARRLQSAHPSLKVQAEVADIREADRLMRIGQMRRPHFIFHAAAHKHVPLMEDAPEEAIKNNVLGTLNMARMADACSAKRFVLISTDKAVHPSSIMGASKRVAELVVRELAHRSRTAFTAVRFGNVLGSAGSVVPIFKEQIERGGPVTVTHPECTRYFMTIAEAVGLVLLAGLGGYGDLCILDMGEPIRIADLAEHMITMAGLVPGTDIPIVFTGLRPGEKLAEALFTDEEELTQEVRNKIYVAKSPPPPADFQERLDVLCQAAANGDRDALTLALRRIVPTYGALPVLELVPEIDSRETFTTVAPLRPKVASAS